MHIVCNGDNLHEMSDPVFWKKLRKNVISEYAHRVTIVKGMNILSRKQSNIICFLSEKDQLKEFASKGSKFCPLRLNFFLRGLMCRKADRKSQKMSPILKMAGVLSCIISP